MKRYDSYKDSGVEWLGEIPKEWNTSKMKFELTIFGRIGFRGYTTEDIVDEGEGVISLSPSNITDDFDLKLSNSTFISYEKYDQSPEIKVFENDIVLVKTSSIGKVTIIKGESLPKMTLNPQLIVLKKVKPNNRFLYYYLISSYFQYELQNEKSGGVMSTISQQKIKDFNLIIPPLFEQQQIVSFLDTKTSLIDSLIEKTRRKIELLKEKRTSLINEVVTKGLNPNVEMKDSGVEWIGEIPSHWITPKLNYLSNKITDGEHISPKFTESGIPFLSSKDVRETGIDMNVDKFVSIEDSVKMRKRCNPEYGDVLVVGRGNSIGRISIVNSSEVFCLLGSVILLKHKKEKILNTYLFFYLQSPKVFEQLINTSSHSVQPTIYLEGIQKQIIILPSLSEQEQIVEYLDEQTQLIDNTISIEEKKIKLLKEYRQSLISEVVTGKRKVV